MWAIEVTTLFCQVGNLMRNSKLYKFKTRAGRQNLASDLE